MWTTYFKKMLATLKNLYVPANEASFINSKIEKEIMKGRK